MQANSHEQSYLLGELESLGFSTIRINEFNDITELQDLVSAIKENFLTEFLQARAVEDTASV
jgi:hypothetical protein